MPADIGKHHTLFTVKKFDADQTEWVISESGIAEPVEQDFINFHVEPYEETTTEGNLITDAGWNLIMANIAGSAGTLWSASVGRIGAGNGTSSVNYTDTDLSAASGSGNRFFQTFSGAPIIGSGHSAGVTFNASFGSANGNFAWQEFCVDQGTSTGTTVTATMLNHGLSSQGTKSSGQTWIAVVNITWS